jgi:hypothetical protein
MDRRWHSTIGLYRVTLTEVSVVKAYYCAAERRLTYPSPGQGTWFLLSHQPDKVLAAAPVSGYSSIESTIPPMTAFHATGKLIVGSRLRSLYHVAKQRTFPRKCV